LPSILLVQSALIRRRIIEHIPVVRFTDHANSADVKPAVHSWFAIVNAAGKLGDAIWEAAQMQAGCGCFSPWSQ
jgi:hypothetical protein